MIRVLKNIRLELLAILAIVVCMALALGWIRHIVSESQKPTNSELLQIRKLLEESKLERQYPRYPRTDAQFDRDGLRREMGLKPATLPSTTQPSMGSVKPF